MVPKQLLKGKTVQYKKVNYANFLNGINVDYDEHILPINYSTNTYNFSFLSGALTTGLGISDIHFPNTLSDTDKSTRTVNLSNYSIKATWLYRRENTARSTSFTDFYYYNQLIFQTTDGDFYSLDICNSQDYIRKINNINLNHVPTIINYNLNGEDSILICSPSGMWVWDYTKTTGAVKIDNAPKIKNMCLHYERLFATVDDNRNEIWFSDDLDPTNWNVSLEEAGFIKFNDNRGIVNRVLSFNDYVYVFREYGISRITAYANQSEFNVAQLFVSSGKIYGGSVCECGDKIIMLTANGLYAFDGYNTTKINLNIDKLFLGTQNIMCQSCYCNGKYYLACNLNFNDDKKIMCENNTNYVNNALLELDLETKNLNIMRGVDIRNLNAVFDDKVNKVIVCYYDGTNYKIGELGNFGKVFTTVLPKCWQSPFSDFGYPEKYKIIKDIYLKSDNAVTITIRTEKLSKSYTLNPKDGVVHLRTLVKGKHIAIDFESNSDNAKISTPTVIMGLV